MPKFSLWQMMIAVFVLAIGMAVSRLPEGSWFDIPLVTLGYYFARSAYQRAREVRRALADNCGLLPARIAGGRTLFALFLLVIAAMPMALVLRVIAAGKLVVPEPFELYWSYRDLPFALAALAMLAATCLEPWNDRRPRALKPRQQAYVAVTIAVALVSVVAYWTNELLIWHLVYLALAGIEMADSPRLLPPEMQGNAAVRIHMFVHGSLAGMVPLVINVACVACLFKWWQRRRILMIVLSLGCAAEFAAAWWLAGPGLRQLSLPLSEAVQSPPLYAVAIAVPLLMLGAALLAWRRLATIPTDAPPSGFRRRLFHETWFASGLLGLTAIAALGRILAKVNAEFGSLLLDLSDPRSIVEVLLYDPLDYLWWAAAIAGLGQAAMKWRKRGAALPEITPAINVAQFLVVGIASVVVALASAPVIAAFSFSLWFLIFGM